MEKGKKIAIKRGKKEKKKEKVERKTDNGQTAPSIAIEASGANDNTPANDRQLS